MKTLYQHWRLGRCQVRSFTYNGRTFLASRRFDRTSQGGRPYELSPIYDMLPMRFAPKTAGDLPFEPAPINLEPAVKNVHWEVAYAAAVQFWHEVLADDQISDHFKALAQQQLRVVEEFARVIARMA